MHPEIEPASSPIAPSSTRRRGERLPGGTQFGPYTIEGLIGRGGMGQVYVARDSVYGTTVALKVLHPDMHADAGWRSRFNEEGLVGTRLKHPHVLSARELVENEGRIALVLDLISGGQTLEKVIKRDFRSGIPLVPALQLFLRILQGIDYLHAKGVVHGDIKPENVLIHGDLRSPDTWIPKVTDFGTVALIANPVEIDGRPAVIATPRYASPEHLLGVDRLEVRSDVYCLGLVLHFLLTGHHVSNASNVQAALDRTMLPVPILALVDQPEGVIDVFKQATARAAADRFATARELALAVRGLLEAAGVPLDLEDVQSELATEVDGEDAGPAEDGELVGFDSDVSSVDPRLGLSAEGEDPDMEDVPTVDPPQAKVSGPGGGVDVEPIPLFVWVAGGIASLLLVVIAVFAWPG